MYSCSEVVLTVLMRSKKVILLNIHYFHGPTSSLKRKIHADVRICLKISHIILEGHNFLGFKFLRKWWCKFLNLYGKSWPNMIRCQKKYRPSDVGTLNFRWIIYFWYFCFIWENKSSLALFTRIKQKYQKWIIHRKITVETYMILSLFHKYSNAVLNLVLNLLLNLASCSVGVHGRTSTRTSRSEFWGL
jgi:hypothetical protein